MKVASSPMVRLRVACIDGSLFRFAVQGANGAWTEVATQTDGSFLPPWDRAVRTGVYVAGEGASAAFDYFVSTPDANQLFSR